MFFQFAKASPAGGVVYSEFPEAFRFDFELVASAQASLVEQSECAFYSGGGQSEGFGQPGEGDRAHDETTSQLGLCLVRTALGVFCGRECLAGASVDDVGDLLVVGIFDRGIHG